MSTDVNEVVVDRYEGRLRDRYDGVDVTRRTERVSDALFPDLGRRSEAGYVGAGYVWVVRSPDEASQLSTSMDPDDRGEVDRVLLILHRGSNAWTIPGGGRETGESFEDAAVREVREETGVDCEIEDCLSVERRTTVADGHAQRLHTLWVTFDGRYVDGSISVQASELNGAAWFATRPRTVDEWVRDRADDWFSD